MDPLGDVLVVAATVVAAVSAAVTFVGEVLYGSREVKKLYDTADSWTPLLGTHQNFLEVFDIPVHTGGPATRLVFATNINTTDKIMESLPAQEERTIRVCYAENIELSNEGPHLIGPAFAGSSAMLSQSDSSPRRVQWETRSYRFATLLDDESYIDSLSLARGTIRRTLRCAVYTTESDQIVCRYSQPIHLCQALIDRQ